MNRKDTIKCIEIMQAYVDGADIECRVDGGAWRSASAPIWDHVLTYRIKPTARDFWISDESEIYDHEEYENMAECERDGLFLVREVLDSE